MNISTIIDMLQKDPTIINDVPAFISRMNLRNIRQVQKQHTVVVDVESLVSVADMHGGRCSQQDVQSARRSIDAKLLRDESERRFAQVKEAIDSGTVTNSTEMKLKFSE